MFDVSAGRAERAVGLGYGREAAGSGCQVSWGDSATHLSLNRTTQVHHDVLHSPPDLCRLTPTHAHTKYRVRKGKTIETAKKATQSLRTWQRPVGESVLSLYSFQNVPDCYTVYHAD